MLAGKDLDQLGGLIFWAKDYNDCYALVISADGKFAVGRKLVGRWINPIAKTGNPAVKTGIGQTNKLHIRTEGNLVTAFIASRVIGIFEGSIQRLVALAALMPIVAGIGGNSGNQTITMIVRAAALGQVTREQSRALIRKEILVSLLNGVIWGGVMGVVAMMLYKDFTLGLVMVLAMTLNLMLAAMMGVLIPMTMLRMGRDPAVGSSVMITAVTDSGGFFIFLGLATLFLM